MLEQLPGELRRVASQLRDPRQVAMGRVRQHMLQTMAELVKQHPQVFVGEQARVRFGGRREIAIKASDRQRWSPLGIDTANA